MRLDGPERVERLVQQIAHDAGLGRVARGANVVDRQIVVHAHVRLDEAGHLPGLARAIETLQEQNVPASGRAAIAFAVALLIWMREGCANCCTQCRGVTRLGSPDTVCQTSFFHAASCVPTE